MRNTTKILSEEINKIKHLIKFNTNTIVEQDLWVRKAASGPQKCGKDATWYNEPRNSNRGSNRSSGGGYVGKTPFDEISNYRSYDNDEQTKTLNDFKRDMGSLPQGVLSGGVDVSKIKNVPPVYIAAKRDSDRLSRMLKNENYMKWFDEKGLIKPEAESFKNNFESWFTYYLPFFIGKTTVTPIDILNHFTSTGGINNYEKIVNNLYKK
jgi:hypothetical protein